MRAVCLIREQLHYRREIFIGGLKRAGYSVVPVIESPAVGDVLVIWNRYGGYDLEANRFERGGATVIVAENGYFGKDWLDSEWFALSRHQHNGAGEWPDGDASRWDSLGIAFEPWRDGGDETVILPQRGIGPPDVAMPSGWAERAQARFGGRIRPHPGQNKGRALRDDLERASAVLTWGSGAALKALLWGIPVYYDFARWIGAAAAAPLGWNEPFRGDRLPMLRRLAWAMWSAEEIGSGVAFEALRS